MCQSGSVFERVAVAEAEPSMVRAGRRARVERVLSLAAHLPPQDRFLLRQVFEFGAAIHEIARQSRCLRGVIHRRIHRILRRLRSPLYAYFVARPGLFPPAQERAGRLVIVEGYTLAGAAEAIGCTLHAVRAHIAALRKMAAAEAAYQASRPFIER